MRQWLILLISAGISCCPKTIFPQIMDLGNLKKAFEKDNTITLRRSDVTISSYNYKWDDFLVEALLFTPNKVYIEKGFRFPGLILIPGPRKTARDLIPYGVQLAKDGFACMAVSQSGSGGMKALIRGLEKFRKEGFVNAYKIGLVGYGNGVSSAFALAFRLNNIRALAGVSGGYSQVKIPEKSTLLCPVLLLHGEKDPLSPVSQVYTLKKKLGGFTPDCQIRILPRRGHDIDLLSHTLYVNEFFRQKIILPIKKITIKTLSQTSEEIEGRNLLLSILQSFKLTRWFFTDKVLIKQGRRSKSHPILTLATQHNKNKPLFLATFLHEQIHWYVKFLRNTGEILQELRSRFPDAPSTPSLSGRPTKQSAYLHLIVCYLEYAALAEIYTTASAKLTLTGRDIHQWVYNTIFKNLDYFKTLYKKYQVLLEK